VSGKNDIGFIGTNGKVGKMAHFQDLGFGVGGWQFGMGVPARMLNGTDDQM